MNIAELKDNFFALVPSHPPNGWEIEEHLENITGLKTELQDLILSHVPAIWSVSHSLCYSYLNAVKSALDCLPVERLPQWIVDTLDIYEKNGLRAAQQFMGDVETNFLCRIRGEAGYDLRDAALRLEPYARSILQRKVSLVPGPRIFTDTESIFLPNKLTLCTQDEDNFLLYKLIVSFQLCIVLQDTYRFELSPDHALVQVLEQSYGISRLPARIGLDAFFSLFPDPDLAEDIFTVSEACRISNYLAATFPGLWRDTADIRTFLAASRPQPDKLPVHSKIIEELIRRVITGHDTGGLSGAKISPLLDQVHHEFSKPALNITESAGKTAALYGLLAETREPYTKVPPVFYMGKLDPLAARQGILRRRNAAREEFVKALAAVMLQTGKQADGPDKRDDTPPTASPGLSGEKDARMLLFSQKQKENNNISAEEEGGTRFLTLAAPEVEFPEPLQKLVTEIKADLGSIPRDYITAAQGMAGQAAPPSQASAIAPGESLVAPITYDEWDFRRSGFRKDWCILLEKQVQPIKGTFVDATLEKYRGLLRQLKKQFEMLRTSERFIKRQRDGTDIDLDALIEAISDTSAGKPPSERLFSRLQRDERDIAVLFLVDMSSSTEGWINQALKESLILMGEALQVLGDRFAIYGFSGMRRSRSDFYRVKEFHESYNEEIKGRIAGIAPQEYTRMGPALRHAVELLKGVEAKVRLLVTLSDGKPEDYDDYKGEYAIEDTRHALIEAKAATIHPFCITIDKRAHDYIAHMYGEVNYIFVDEVRKLPIRLPEIYRVLTT